MKKNPITKKFPGSVQGKVRFTLYPVKVGSKLSITGYGVDRNDPVHNMSQQIHAGLLKNGGSRSDATLRYQVDTEPGNSGSGIIDTRTRRLIGVHTHGGCDSGLNTEGNQGTSLAYHQRFKAAVYQCLREERKLKYQNR
jgi:V8-like Glu-specific endopeptidase